MRSPFRLIPGAKVSSSSTMVPKLKPSTLSVRYVILSAVSTRVLSDQLSVTHCLPRSLQVVAQDVPSEPMA